MRRREFILGLSAASMNGVLEAFASDGVGATSTQPDRSTVGSSFYSNPMLIDSFLDIRGRVQGGGALISQGVREAYGTGSLAMSLPGNGVTAFTTKKHALANVDPAQLGTIAWHTQLFEPYRTIATTQLFLGRDEAFSAPEATRYSPATIDGGFWDCAHVTEFKGLPKGTGPLDVRWRVTPNSTTGPELTAPSIIKCVIGCAGGTPEFVFTFDDCYKSPMDVAVPMFDTYGIKATFHIPTTEVGTKNKLTWEDIRTLHAQGHEIGLDGRTDDRIMTLMPSMEALVADLEKGQKALVGNGIPRAISGCYPNGIVGGDGTGAYPKPVNLGLATSNGTTSVLVASTAGLSSGMSVLGYQVPSATIITKVDSSVQITLSNKVPPQQKPMCAVDRTGIFYPGKLQAALAQAGFRSFRQTPRRVGSNDMFVRAGIPQPLMLYGQGFTGLTVEKWSTVKALLDKAILRGTALIFNMHSVVACGGSINMDSALLEKMIEYLGPMYAAGRINVSTQGALEEKYRGNLLPNLLAQHTP